MGLPDLEIIRCDGSTHNLQELDGKVIIFVNTASEWRLRAQLGQLEELYQKYKDQGFIVVGAPSRQFNQEPLSNEEMADQYRKRFGVTYPLLALSWVNGDDESDLASWLKKEAPGEITWNFTKFLVNRDGKVVKRYDPKVEPSEFEDDIKALLG